MSQGTSIKVSRRKSRWWYAFQPISVELDGVIVGKLVGEDSMMVEVRPGQHVLRVKFRLVHWSNKLTLSVAEGDQRLVQCQTDWAGYPSIQLASD